MKLYKYYLSSLIDSDEIFLGYFIQVNPSLDIDDSLPEFVRGHLDSAIIYQMIIDAVNLLNMELVGRTINEEDSTLIKFNRSENSYWGRESTIKYFKIRFIPAA